MPVINMSLKTFGIILFLFEIFYGILGIDPIVNTDVGQIQGLSADDGDYNMFLGIPYASVNEDNVFAESIPYPRFESTFQAIDDSAICPQIEEFNRTIVGSLDCLTLNIFVPTSATPTNRLPVLVYIYGGGFAFGFGNRFLYGPRYLVRHNIILVTLNYRVGPYGFTCLNSPSVPGNQGLKDQVLALKWIQKHIGAFNGDASKITISGNSAGAISVDLHILSKHEKLYDKAILQSGTAMGSLIGDPERRNSGDILSLALYLGLITNNTDEALKYLSDINSSAVIDAANKLGILSEFGPCIENQYNNVNNFITEDWLTANASKIENMNIIIGVNDDEMFGVFTSDKDEDYKNLRIIQETLQNAFNVSNPDFDGMADIVQHFYYGDQELSASIRQNIADFLSDFFFMHPAYRSIKKYLDYGAEKIFFYVFSHVGERNFVRHKDNISNKSGGALHADELGYLFDISYMKNWPLTAEDQVVIDYITTLWANFVKYGDPGSQWEPITNSEPLKRPFLDIGTELVSGGRPFNKRATFWDLFYKTNKHLQIIVPPSPSPSSSVTIKSSQLFIMLTLFFLFYATH